MLVLSIDCAGSGCGVGVWRDGAMVAERFESMERGQDQRLMPLVVETMQKASVTFDQLDRIAVTRGPGSFTGLRIGLAAARGLGLAANKPAVGIDRFSIYHEALRLTGQNLLVVLQSRRQELYCRSYPKNGQADAPAMWPAEDIAAFLQNHPDTALCGDMPPALFPSTLPLPEAEYVIAARLAAAADLSDPAYTARPLYLRAPDVTMPAPKGHTLQLLTLQQTALLAALHAESFSTAAWSEKQIRDSLALETTRGWGVYVERALAGFILCQIIPGQSEVLTLCVQPSHRRRGLGEQLVNTAAEAAKNAGSFLFLEVAADNQAALALYEKSGFKRTGMRPNYYRLGSAGVDAVLLTRHH